METRVPGTGSPKAVAAGHRHHLKVVINSQGPVTFTGIYEDGAMEPIASNFNSDPYKSAMGAMAKALAIRGVTP